MLSWGCPRHDLYGPLTSRTPPRGSAWLATLVCRNSRLCGPPIFGLAVAPYAMYLGSYHARRLTPKKYRWALYPLVRPPDLRSISRESLTPHASSPDVAHVLHGVSEVRPAREPTRWMRGMPRCSGVDRFNGQHFGCAATSAAGLTEKRGGACSQNAHKVERTRRHGLAARVIEMP